ncbi:hypothetical protein Tsubulata_042382 [Turnera subulata]|uniref:Outer envelope pore protein 24, chloroplastic n=1 Tax=Turnera subulata TaxID=218843 RepID=A0A9Q0IZW1_9ROSI|nr:hypothetical protein Tsubulata_042382 [Turnera subulata]
MIRSAVSIRGNKGVTAALATNAGDLRLRAVISDAIFITSGATTFDLDALCLSIKKPGSFVVDFDLPNQDVRFQFMNRVNLLEKQLNWTYCHSRGENRTVLDGTLVLDLANKVSASWELGSGSSRNRKLKYTHIHRGATTLEPSYDFGNGAWDLSVSHNLEGDVVRASYNTRSKNLGLEWSCKSGLYKEGSVKVLASFNPAERLQRPKLSAESSWNFEM